MVKRMKRGGILSVITDIFTGGPEYKTVRAESQNPLPVKTIAAMAIITLLFMFIIFSFVQIAELTSDIGDLKDEIKAQQALESKLTGELSHKYSFADIENGAGEMGLTDGENQTIYLPDTEIAP